MEIPMAPVPESFDKLVRRFTADDDDVNEVYRVSLAGALRLGRDPLDILSYLAGLGRRVASLDELVHAINSDPEEEELAAHIVAEGVAVSVASSGAWQLFTP